MYGAPTGAARDWARMAFTGAGQHRARGDQFLGAALWEKERDRKAVLAALDRLAEELHKREAEKAAKKKKGGWFGAGGAGAGAGIGALLAVPTGGLSVAAGAALGSGIGGGVGSAIDTATGGSGAAGQQISNTAFQLAKWDDDSYMDYPFFTGGVRGLQNSVSQYVSGPGEAPSMTAGMLPMR